MGRITVNGRELTGNSISIRNGELTVDGVKQDGALSGVVELRILEGTVGSIECDGHVTCGAVTGDVRASGSVKCGDVGGDVHAGGSVTCARVTGSLTAGGSVHTTR